MNIKHHPIFDINKVIEHYSKKDGVAISYVCTSAANLGTVAVDIFYRDTPHPEFGNRYFGLYNNPFSKDAEIMITNADTIEDLEFGMVEGPEGWEYSQHRHDFRSVDGCAIDGGRAYFKRIGDLSKPCKFMKVLNGKFKVVETEKLMEKT